MDNNEIHLDNLLIKKIKQGDNTCFEILYEKYKGKIYNFILNISQGDNYLAEEIVQMIFIRIWEMRFDLNHEGNFSKYLFIMAKNLFVTELRKRANEFVYHEHVLANRTEKEYTVDKEVDYKLLEEEIHRLINQLPPSRRLVYKLSKKDNMSNSEIAEMLNISENTVNSHLAKANRFMREKLSVRYGTTVWVVCLLTII